MDESEVFGKFPSDGNSLRNIPIRNPAKRGVQIIKIDIEVQWPDPWICAGSGRCLLQLCISQRS